MTIEAEVERDAQPGFLERAVDRLNPILVREIQQSLSGRAFQFLLAMSTFAVIALGLAFAWFGRDGEENGRGAFVACMVCIAPLVLFLLPMQAFASMRQEMTGGAADQLSLTRLGPLRIVTGKIAAGFAQFLMFLAVFAPVMALTFLLRGVDVPTILLVLLFAALSSLAANTLCIAVAPVGRTRAIQQLIQGLTAAGLMIATFTAMVASYQIAREVGWLLRGGDGTEALVSIVGAYAIGIALAGVIGTTALAHPHENRSTPFRLFAVGLLPLLAAWVWYVADASDMDEAGSILATALAIMLSPFWLWASCEEASLSPRVRTLVPGRPFGLLSAPFLPGGQRGLLFSVVLAVLSLGVALLLPLLAGESPDRTDFLRALSAWSYVVILSGLARLIRSRLGPGTRKSLIAFTVTLAAVGLACVLPFAIELLVTGTVRGQWSVFHVMNPFYTIDTLGRHRSVAIALTGIAGIVIVVSMPSMWRGVREVSLAAQERRRRQRAG